MSEYPLDSLLQGLNPSQCEAVTFGMGPLLVIAGAGSGKTRVLTTRIHYLIKQGALPHQILAVTFTNKAALEMKNRIPYEYRHLVQFGTFHSICLRILRENLLHLGFTQSFNIYDDQDQLTLIKECMKELNVDEKRLHPKRVRERISRCKDDLKSPQDEEANMMDFEDRLFVPIYQKYEAKLQFYGGFDFGDLIARAVRLFAESPEILQNYQERFRYILIDEYQDTNYAQYVFIHLLAKKYRNITVVGDPDQSIYEWRGANMENIMNFEKDYLGSKTIRLEQNYRSTNTILKAANAVISQNIYRKPKDLWSNKGEGELIDLYRGYNERDESQFVINRVLEYRSEGRSLKEMVCFYRTHTQSRVLEEELRRHNLPYQIFGGIKFYSRKEVKDILAYLRVVLNPSDELSLKRILNVPKRGIGKTSLIKIENYQNAHQITFFEALKSFCFATKQSAKLTKTLQSFVLLIEGLQRVRNDLPLSLFVEEVLKKSTYLKSLEEEGTLEAKVRLDNLREFLESVSEFEGQEPSTMEGDVLERYLEFVSLQTSLDENNPEEQDMLTLMTLHSAKGLEFPVVFILGMEEELLPHQNALSGSNREVEEERRLCYVGMTRAQEKLILSHAVSRKVFGLQKSQYPSRFLQEIPSQFINKVYRDYGLEPEDHFDLTDDDEMDILYY